MVFTGSIERLILTEPQFRMHQVEIANLRRIDRTQWDRLLVVKHHPLCCLAFELGVFTGWIESASMREGAARASAEMRRVFIDWRTGI